MTGHENTDAEFHDTEDRRQRTGRYAEWRRWGSAILVVASLTIMLTGGALALRRLSRSVPWNGLAADIVNALPASRDAGSKDTMSADEAERRYPKETSPVDFNGNGVDDYTDIVAGARKDAQAAPTYDSGYYQGGYPPDDRGACTDLVWRAFREAGYDLKAMVDADIEADPASYAAVVGDPDPSIDFRRTGVLDVFFSKYGQTLTTDVSDRGQWQGGDIVVFEHVRHIGVISDKRDSDGIPYVLHNMAQRQRENNYLAFARHMTVTGHYRFDASKVPQLVLKAWR